MASAAAAIQGTRNAKKQRERAEMKTMIEYLNEMDDNKQYQETEVKRRLEAEKQRISNREKKKQEEIKRMHKFTDEKGYFDYNEFIEWSKKIDKEQNEKKQMELDKVKIELDKIKAEYKRSEEIKKQRREQSEKKQYEANMKEFKQMGLGFLGLVSAFVAYKVLPQFLTQRRVSRRSSKKRQNSSTKMAKYRRVNRR